MKRIVIIALMTLALATQVACQAGAEDSKTTDAQFATVGDKAPAFTLTSAAGKKHSLSDFAGKFVVLEWVNFGCPFVKKHYNSENMQNLQTAYTEKGVIWLSICSSGPGKQGYFDGDELTAELESKKAHATAYLIDADGKVGRMYEAKTTPHMFVIDPKGVLIYAGAIDDRPSTQVEDVEGATNYVQQALDAAMAGKKVEVTATKSYGCSVKYAN
jgi:peroxiredoxin